MTTQSKHAPRPWRFVVDGEMDDDCNIPKVDAPLNYQAKGYCNNPFIIGADGEEVVGCSEYNVFAGPNQAANVALLLSAPELLAALEGTTHMLENLCNDMQRHGFHRDALQNVRGVIDRNRAAISKATNTPNP